MISELTNSYWIDFLTSIAKATDELGNPDKIWYRGSGRVSIDVNDNKVDLYLCPSLLRHTNAEEREIWIYNTFVKFSHKIFGKPDNDWQTLINMQHYGIPTRLLDWTDNFGTGLFFAAYWNNIKKYKEDAVMYLLDPEKLNKSTIFSEGVIQNLSKVQDFSYETIYLNKQNYKGREVDFPVAIEPVLENERIFAQRGAFTIHSNADSNFENDNDSIKKVLLKKEAIPAAIEFLKLANINAFTVFPDIKGIADFINDTSKLIHWKDATI